VPPRIHSSVVTQPYAGVVRTGLAGACALFGAAVAPATATEGSAGGGAGYVAKPVVAKVTCVRSCATRGRPQAGSVLQLTGRALGGVRKVVFAGGVGRSDDVASPARPVGSRRLQVQVPKAAVSGPLTVVAAPRVRSRASRSIAILPPPSVNITPVTGDHVFPIQGLHDFGGAGAVFGAGRGGRSHQGHDVFARCGTPVVAAHGGVIKHTAYHGAAGNYLVIDGAATDFDYAYMHLTERSAFVRGDAVATGQQIGSVGQTGNARGCHLHFEMWAAPGWYKGGRPFDPLPSLKAWAAGSPPPVAAGRSTRR
jgi:murein DD-endopeptidase MepM/ murein hydrolase activator NlpD